MKTKSKKNTVYPGNPFEYNVKTYDKNVELVQNKLFDLFKINPLKIIYIF